MAIKSLAERKVCIIWLLSCLTLIEMTAVPRDGPIRTQNCRIYSAERENVRIAFDGAPYQDASTGLMEV